MRFPVTVMSLPKSSPAGIYFGQESILLALLIERLCRFRYLHRGNHAARSAIDLMGLSLGQSVLPDRQQLAQERRGPSCRRSVTL